MRILTENSVIYIVRQLFLIAGIKRNGEDLNVHYNAGNHQITVPLSRNKEIIFNLMKESETEQLLKGEIEFKTVLSFDRKVNIPLFITNGNDDFSSINNDRMIIYADIITLSFLLLSRYEETLVTEKDQYNRFQYKDSLAYKYSFIDIPIVDEYAMLLRREVLRFIPAIELYKRKGTIIPTHDIDMILRFGGLLRNLDTIIGGDIIKRKSVSMAFKSSKACFAAIKNSKNDQLIIAINRLIEISRACGLCSEFYFKGLRKGDNDATYDIFIPEVKYCMKMIKDAGMIVGMHGSHDSYDNELNFNREKENIESVSGEVVKTGRQHFLRFDINKTLSVWQSCGVQNDSTLGYAEQEGFRCGTCHEYYLYDLKNDCVSTVKEHPLIVMEGTLFGYRGQNNESSLKNIERLYTRCQAVEGDFVILWHNHSVFREYEKKFNEIYCRFMESVRQIS
jgi:hypothetical protein